MLNITNIPSARVPFIDARTGLISREWYLFLFNLFNLTGSGQNPTSLEDLQKSPDAATYAATLEQFLNDLRQQVDSAPSAPGVSELASTVDALTQLLNTLPRTELGSMAAVQQDNTRFIGYSLVPSPPVVYNPGVTAWNEDDGTLDVGLYGGSVLQVGQEMMFYAKNTSGSLIPNGTPVMFTGTVGASGKLTFGLAVADGSVPADYMMGVTTQDIPNNGFGYVANFGLVRGFNTTGAPYGETWVDGDLLYFGAASPGTWTKVKPVAPRIDVPVAVVVNAGSGGSGSIFVRMTVAEALSRLQDVYINGTGTPLAGQVLIYDATQARWENNRITAGTGITITNGDGAITITNSGAGSATNLVGGVAGSVPYQSAPNTTTFLGIGTAGQVLQVNAGGTAPQWVGSTGTGNVVRATSPTLVTPILGVPQSGDFSTGTFTWPTFNQDTTGNAGTVTDGVYTVGNQNIAGIKTFTDEVAVTVNSASAAISITQNGAGKGIESTTSALNYLAGFLGIGRNVGGVSTPACNLHLEAPSLSGVTAAVELLRLAWTDSPNFDQLAGAGTKITFYQPSASVQSEVANIQVRKVSGAENNLAASMTLATHDGTTLTDRLRINNLGFMALLAGSFGRAAPVTKTANFTVADTENWLIVNNATANTTVTLPSAGTWTGREIMVKNLSALYTVVSASSNVVPLVGGAASTAILPAGAGKWATLVSDGTSWIIMQAA
jgi:hypothetical protein